jgi:NIMA (never in mitosis gene a)-related kinase
MELASAGDLQKKINEHIKNHSYFTEGEIWQVLIQLSRGLKALHDINILHRDLKCANIFCTEDGKFKLGDLNVSKVAKSGLARTQTGTPYYTSPEVWLNKTYNSKCDVWSLGCVIYEMAALRPPFRANNLKELCSRIQRGIYERIPAHYSDDLFSIINTCLKVNPSSRLSACQILENSKVIKHTPNTEKYAFDNDKTKKYNLLGTILCPRNFKVLKNALPAANYEDDPKPKSVRRKAERANSARSLGQPDIPRVITTPKVDDGKSKEVKYAFMHQKKELFPAPRK